MLSNRYDTLDHANCQRVCCTCKQVNAQIKAMVRCANCWNWFHCDCVDYNEIPRKYGLDYICQECPNVKGRESNCGNEVGAAELASIITTTTKNTSCIRSLEVLPTVKFLITIIDTCQKYCISYE